jgi:hypothetical protein
MSSDFPPQQSVAPKTTEQEDITLAGQRKINLIWEYTQAFIAGLIAIAMVVSALLKINDLTITNSFFLVVGFYFSRTNHAAIGGVGAKPNEKYEGR